MARNCKCVIKQNQQLIKNLKMAKIQIKMRKTKKMMMKKIQYKKNAIQI